MVNLDWRVESRAGISLVTLVVENPTDAAQRVRVANLLDGPVWPPRREGIPEAGWDDGGFEGVVGPGESRSLGYATPATPAEPTPTEEPSAEPSVEPPTDSTEPPAELVWTERGGETEQPRETEAEIESATFEDETTPEGVVRSLGDPRPPADAVPTDDDTGFGGDAMPTTDCSSLRRSP